MREFQYYIHIIYIRPDSFKNLELRSVLLSTSKTENRICHQKDSSRTSVSLFSANLPTLPLCYNCVVRGKDQGCSSRGPSSNWLLRATHGPCWMSRHSKFMQNWLTCASVTLEELQIANLDLAQKLHSFRQGCITQAINYSKAEANGRNPSV